MSSAERWKEPTALLPLRWGNYTDRYLAGLTLIVAGTLGLQGSNNWILPLLLQSTIAHALGWAIMPARGWRRILVVAPATGQIWLLLTGPQSMWTMTIPFLCWLIVRHRPLRSYLTLVFPIANGIILPEFFHEYPDMPGALAVTAAVLVGSAWLARVIAMSARPSSKSAGTSAKFGR